MRIEDQYSSPIIVIGYRAYPINGFCYDIIYKGEIKSRLNFSRHDNLHYAYMACLDDYKKAMEDAGYLYTIEKYTGDLKDTVNYRYFKNPIKRKLYQFYLWLGKCFDR